MKRIKSVLVVLIFVMSFGTVTANANSYSTDSATLGKTFSSSWSSTRINDADRTFKVGYNTSLINEDYTHTYNSANIHYAYVKNTGNVQNLKGSAGSYAKAEIQHKSGGTVYYSYTY